MLSARNLCGLLSENTDEYASEYMSVLQIISPLFFLFTPWHLIDSFLNSVFTTHGTLLGYSDTTVIKQARKAAALFGVTWRSTNLAPQDSQESPQSNIAPLLKILKTIKEPHGKLSIMTVEIDKRIAAICDVKGSLLVAALVESQTHKGHLPQGVSSDASGTSTEETSSKTSNNTSDNEPNSSDSTHEQEDETAPTEDKDKSKDAGTPTSAKPKPTQTQILMWRVEAMAEALRDDLQDFKMPLGTL